MFLCFKLGKSEIHGRKREYWAVVEKMRLGSSAKDEAG